MDKHSGSLEKYIQLQNLHKFHNGHIGRDAPIIDIDKGEEEDEITNESNSKNDPTVVLTLDVSRWMLVLFFNS